MNQYAGYDVLELPTEGSSGQEDQPERRFYLTDAGTGKRVADDPEAASSGILSYTWVCTSLSEIAELKAFLDARRGRAIPFWLPSFRHQLTLNGDHNPGHTFIDVKAYGYAVHMWPDTGARRHLFFRSRTAVVFYRKATSAVNNQNGTESIYLNAPLGQDVTVADWMVGFLRLCRLEDDLTRIEHQKGGAGTERYARADLRLREIPKEAPL